MTRVIVISGKAGSGKDTLARCIKEDIEESEHVYVAITHYADELKRILRQFYGWDGQKDERGRELLQTVGTGVFRAQDENFWVDRIIQILKMAGDAIPYVVIPDCRFPNEISRFADEGFPILHFHINGAAHEGTPDHEMSAAQKRHISETALDGIKADYYISNNGTIEDLKPAIHILDIPGIFKQMCSTEEAAG